MSDILTGVLIPVEEYRPSVAIRVSLDRLPLLWEDVGGPAERVVLLQPAGTLYVNAWGMRFGLSVNRRATLLASAANPVWRGGTIVGDAVLVGAVQHGVDTCVDPAYSRVLLAATGRFGIEFRAPSGEPGEALPPVAWSDPFAAYGEGLRLARGYPLRAVCVRALD
ncbi:DUF3846 domain-containing protein [Frankia sp. AgPm24]|uniref:DUF3846 domain-containing protein n=1 Tax=Frankia sp. AgPm24 TaxID=631128 RepID=UPI00200E3D9E|nr:DUF3846 domain-containing protein [Frankia sp. AgPm24]MCK9921299.1 DUF3846 domain-containing protein [Frankia sp. AgPm24]